MDTEIVMTNPDSHIVSHFACANGGETMCGRNNDETFNDATVINAGRKHCNGEHPQWMIMTGHAKGCVEMSGVGLNPDDNLVCEVDMKHKGDSIVKSVEFREFIRHNFENTGEWLWRQGVLVEPQECLACHKVASHKWRSVAHKQ